MKTTKDKNVFNDSEEFGSALRRVAERAVTEGVISRKLTDDELHQIENANRRATIRDDITVKAIERIAKARAEIVLTNTFYGVALGQVEPKPSWQFPTMATDGKVHLFNPEFITGLSFDETVGVQLHENEHDVRRHHTRRGNRDPIRWNKATDFAINIDLVDSGVTLPEKVFIDERFRGMSAEDVYRTLEIEEAEEERKRQEAEEQEASDAPEESPDKGDDEGDDEDKADDADGDEERKADDGQPDEGDEGDDDSEGDQGDAPGQDGEGDQGEGAPGGDDGQPGEGDQGEGAGEAEGDGTGSGTDGAEGDASGDGTGAGGMPAEGEGRDPRSSGDPGGCGEVLDASDDLGEIANEDAKWERVFRQAAMLAAKRGTAPGHVAREIGRADHPPQDWREVLRAWFDHGATTQETWNRPNRRFVSSGLYLPGTMRDGINKAVFLIDTSGSVTWYPGALEAIQVECQAALDERIIDELVVIYGDVAPTRIDEYRSGDEIEFDPKGGGGTCMAPLFDYVRTELNDASLIVCFTDLVIEPEAELGPEPACPVLWAVVGFPASVKRYLAATPWNAPGIEVRPS
jgi:predicted metal-dependent peptidase